MEEKSFGFGSRLRAFRQAKGWSQTQLGEGAGENGNNASKQSVVDWEKERHYPKANQIRVLCLRLGVSADELIFGDVREKAKLDLAETALLQLTEQQRMDLLSKMFGPAVPNDVVEKRMPITAARARSKRKADEPRE